MVMPKFETNATDENFHARGEIYELFEKAYRDPAINHHLLFQNLGLFLRSSALAKILFIEELYDLITHQPGNIVEFGCHLGQNLALFENLRAIFEPFNTNRRIIGFDTFTHEGYASRNGDIDGAAEELVGSGYKLPDAYPDTLRQILGYHEKNSVIPNQSRCHVVEGDVTKTVPAYLEANRGDVIALAYFDLATYEPTKICLESIIPRLLPGSVLLMDELNFEAYPGASVAFIEVARKEKLQFEIITSRYIPSRSIVKIKAIN
jgi:hypothetical protein